ncbi:MAG: HD domain-containing protein [Pseudonocardiales bacterium]|nr:HD domain-containing protein [Pseudonocardiales bacterium]
MTTPNWLDAHPRSPAEVVELLFDLYAHRGGTYYDDTVTQTEHALQTAALAHHNGASAELELAALLHDIGHLLVGEHAGIDGFLHQDLHHERLGARLLQRWLPPAVTEPIRLHVAAKRYLVATDPAYARALSQASTRSLAVQGGPMSGPELDAFAQSRYAADACRLRRWDDAAKAPHATTNDVEHYRRTVESLITTDGPTR